MPEGEVLAKELGSAARYLHLDVTDEDAWAAGVDEAVRTFGGLDVLSTMRGRVARPDRSMTTEEYLRIIGVNQLGVFLGMRTAIPAMTRAGRASIVNISSIEGIGGSPGAIAYSASKFAVRGMTKVAAIELAPLGIRVNSIHPGGVDTPMLNDIGGQELIAMLSHPSDAAPRHPRGDRRSSPCFSRPTRAATAPVRSSWRTAASPPASCSAPASTSGGYCEQLYRDDGVQRPHDYQRDGDCEPHAPVRHTG